MFYYELIDPQQVVLVVVLTQYGYGHFSILYIMALNRKGFLVKPPIIWILHHMTIRDLGAITLNMGNHHCCACALE